MQFPPVDPVIWVAVLAFARSAEVLPIVEVLLLITPVSPSGLAMGGLPVRKVVLAADAGVVGDSGSVRSCSAVPPSECAALKDEAVAEWLMLEVLLSIIPM